MHYLCEQIKNAPRLSATKVPAKVRAGWIWHRLVPGFGTAGGAASYSRALVSPSGEIVFVSDRAPGMESLLSLPPFEISYQLLRLKVPFEDKDKAKSLGAVWVGHLKTWACAPHDAEKFREWLGDSKDSAEFNLLET